MDLPIGCCGVTCFAVFSSTLTYNICSYDCPWGCGTPRLMIGGNGGFIPRLSSFVVGTKMVHGPALSQSG